MSVTVTSGAVGNGLGRGRAQTLATLVAVWALVAAAVYVGHPSHALTLHLGVVFLLWRVWRNGRWSLALLRLQAIVGAGVALAMTVAALTGAVGLVMPTLWAAWLFAATGVLLFSPAVNALRCR